MAATEDFHTAARLAIPFQDPSSVTSMRTAGQTSLPLSKKKAPSYLRELHSPHQMELSPCRELTSLGVMTAIHFPLPPEISITMASWTWPLSPHNCLVGTLAS